MTHRPHRIRLVAIAGVLLATGATASAQVVGDINFQDQALNTVVTTQYGAQGLAALFSNLINNPTVVATDDNDPTNHVLAAAPLQTEFNANRMIINFTAPQHLVSFDASFVASTATTTRMETVTAFDASGMMVAQDGPRMVTGDVFTTLFTVATMDMSNTITSVTLEDGTGSNVEIDNLHFEGEAPPPPSGEAPVVVITSPPASTNAPNVALTGTVTGTNVFSPAVISIDFRAPPGQASRTDIPITLTQVGPTDFQFSAPNLAIPLGATQLTVTAQDNFGHVGSALIPIFNLPPVVANVCGAGGSNSTVQYVVTRGACSMAVCTSTAVSFQQATGTGFLVPLNIAQKWISVFSEPRLGPTQDLGCAIEDSQTVVTPTGSGKRQKFQYGRIYAWSMGVFYVPLVFSQVMDASGEDDSVGIPTSDPVIGVVQIDVRTYWFQRFARVIANDLGTTMEIRGTPPKLTVERQGGDLRDLTGAGLTVNAATATVWETYPCTGAGPWQCGPVPSPPERVGPTLDRICEFTQRCEQIPIAGCEEVMWPFAGLLEWAPAGNGDYDYRTVRGWSSENPHLANIDNPLVHENNIDICGASHSLSNCIFPPSDWIIHVRPFATYDPLLDHNFEHLDMELEVEWYYLQYFFGAAGDPAKGDLLTLSGRWIVDCGHPPYRTELHPYAMISYARTMVRHGLLGTYQPIFVNGFYTGLPTTVSVYPPPRPNPNAQLIVFSNHPSASIGNVQVQFNLMSDHAEFTFTGGPQSLPDVSVFGEMYFQGGIAFEGAAQASWQ